MDIKDINIEEYNFNPFTGIGKECCLITAGTERKFNTMTASWGFVGKMWNKNCFQAVVRPNRYTYRFLSKNDSFTVCFFPEGYKKMFSYCGTRSGRDINKIKATGLTPVFDEDGIYFEQASMVLCCRKIYMQEMNAFALDDDLNKTYNSAEPIHCQFIGEIKKALEISGVPVPEELQHDINDNSFKIKRKDPDEIF